MNYGHRQSQTARQSRLVATVQILGPLKLADRLVVWIIGKENVRILAELKQYVEAQPK